MVLGSGEGRRVPEGLAILLRVRGVALLHKEYQVVAPMRAWGGVAPRQAPPGDLLSRLCNVLAMFQLIVLIGFGALC